MPRVRHQHARLHALCHLQHVAKQQLLRHQRAERHIQRHHMHLGNCLRVLKLHRRRPQHAHAHHQQNRPQRQRRRRLKALMPIRMILVRILLTRTVCQQHHKVRHQIRQRMNAVRNQPLRLRHHAHHDLRRRQHHIHHHAHPRRARSGRRALGGGDGGIVVVFFVDVGEGHGRFF